LWKEAAWKHVDVIEYNIKVDLTEVVMAMFRISAGQGFYCRGFHATRR
jgi:hypothetical protein